MDVRTSARPWFLFLACIGYIALAVRDDPVRSRVVGVDGLNGWAAAEAGDIRRTTRRRRPPQ